MPLALVPPLRLVLLFAWLVPVAGVGEWKNDVSTYWKEASPKPRGRAPARMRSCFCRLAVMSGA